MVRAFFVAGAAGSGKSYFSRFLAKKLNLVVIDFDDDLNNFIEAHEDEFKKLGSEKFLATFASKRYLDLIDRAVDALIQSKSVVVAAPFSKHIADPILWNKLISPIKDHDPDPTLFWIQISDALRKERILTRAAKRDEEKLARIDQYILTSPATRPAVQHIQIQGDLPFEGQLKGNV